MVCPFLRFAAVVLVVHGYAFRTEFQRRRQPPVSPDNKSALVAHRDWSAPALRLDDVRQQMDLVCRVLVRIAGVAHEVFRVYQLVESAENGNVPCCRSRFGCALVCNFHGLSLGFLLCHCSFPFPARQKSRCGSVPQRLSRRHIFDSEIIIAPIWQRCKADFWQR